MKIHRASIFLVILLPLLCSATIIGLFFSAAGSGWLMARLAAVTGVHIEQAKGTLIGPLRLYGLQFEQPSTTLACTAIEVDSRLTSLYPPQLEIDQLQVTGLTYSNTSSPTSSPSPQLSFPKLPWWLEIIEVKLHQANLTGILIHQGENKQTIDQLTLRGHWQAGQLRLTGLRLRTAELSLAGTLTADFEQPSLFLEAQIDNRQTPQPWKKIKLQGKLTLNEQQDLGGPVSLSLADQDGPWLDLDGGLSLNLYKLQFQDLTLKNHHRKGHLLLNGQLDFASAEKGLSSRLELRDMDLQPEIGEPLSLSGTIELNGTTDHYQGHFDLDGQARQPLAAHLRGDFNGDLERLQLTKLNADWLQGTVSGELLIKRGAGWRIGGRLKGQRLDPALLHERLQGSFDFDLQGHLDDSGQGLNGELALALNEAVLQQQPLTGQARLQISDGKLTNTNFEIQGKGYNLQGEGDPADRILLSWQVDQLEQLLSGVQGRLRGSGQLTLTDEGGIDAEFSSSGEQLQYEQLSLESWQVQGSIAASRQFQLTFDGRQLSRSATGFPIADGRVEGRGTTATHEIDFRFAQSAGSLQGHLSGGWENDHWQGRINQLLLDDRQLGQWRQTEEAPLQLSPARLSLGSLRLEGQAERTLQLQGEYSPTEQQGSGELSWSNFDLALLNPWLGGPILNGVSSGSVVLQQQPSPYFKGWISVQGKLKTPPWEFTLNQGEWRGDWDRQGLRSQLKLLPLDGGRIAIELDNDEPFALRLPRQLRLRLDGDLPRVEPYLQPWLPPDLNLTAGLKVSADGLWNADRPGQLSGLAELHEGRISWREEESEIGFDLTTARLHWQWNEQLSSQLELQVEERGGMDGEINLPLAARLPLRLPPQLPLNGNLSTRLQELGLLALLFPGEIQESSGQLKLDLQLGGSLRQPTLQGDLHLFDCRGYLIRPGIQLNDVELQGNFNRQRFLLDSFQARSGKGTLTGTGHLRLDGWKPAHYHLELNGSNIQAANLSELQAEVSPELTIDGDLDQLTINGDIRIPRLLISGRQKTDLAQNSPDLLIVDAPEESTEPLRIKPQLDLRLHLGDQVLLKTAGIDARLEGDLRLESTPQQMLAATGQIQVAKGRYASYGVNLDINRGNLIFNGGPINQPVLDILALRTAGEIKAGVLVTGTPKQPQVKLYSEPTLPDTDILSYIVLGRPIGADGNRNGALMTAAGALLSQGESVVLQEKLKDKLGLDILDINAGNGDAKSSVITTGKYLSPDLYISFGYSLFNNNSEVKLRYSLSPRWEVESNFGTESGADLFYKIDIP